jgi:DNA-binding transcriptional ArsR family regulator
MLSALAQETRVSIYKLLVQEGKGGIAAGVISEILQVPAATLSFHLSQMSNAGLLKSRKSGRSVMYSAKRKAIKNLASYLTENSFKENNKTVKKTKIDLGLGEDIVNDAE